MFQNALGQCVFSLSFCHVDSITNPVKFSQVILCLVSCPYWHFNCCILIAMFLPWKPFHSNVIFSKRRKYFKKKLYLKGLKKYPGLSRGFCQLGFPCLSNHGPGLYKRLRIKRLWFLINICKHRIMFIFIHVLNIFNWH